MSSKKRRAKEDGRSYDHSTVPKVLVFVLIAIAVVAVLIVVIMEHNEPEPQPLSQSVDPHVSSQPSQEVAKPTQPSSQKGSDPLGLGAIHQKPGKRAILAFDNEG